MHFGHFAFTLDLDYFDQLVFIVHVNDIFLLFDSRALGLLLVITSRENLPAESLF